MPKALAALCGGAVLAGLVVAVARPLPARASIPTPGIVSTFAGGSITGYGTSIYQFPQGLVLTGSSLMIADNSGSVVRALDTTTGVETVYAGDFLVGSTGDGGAATSASLNHPRGLALDGAGDLFIATADSVRKVTPGGVISTLASGLTTPEGVTVDTAGNVLVTDTTNNKILKISSGGTVSTFAGNGTAGFTGDGGLATSAELSHPEGVFVSGTGDVWISDTGNSRVRKVDHAGGNINTVAGGGGAGPVCANGTATSLAVFFPEGLSMDSHGNLIITDTGDNCVRSLSGTTLTTLIQGAGSPFDAIADAAGNLYISSPTGPNPDVVRVNAGTMTLTPVAGSVNCQVYGLGGQASAAMLCQPYAVTFDSIGNLYVADPQAETVLKIDPAGILTKVAGTGNSGYSPDGTLATSADLSGPSGLAFNSTDDLFISDDGNRVIRRVDHVTGNIYTVAGTPGQYGFSGDGGPATSAKFFQPEGIAFDAAGNLYISDLGNYRVRKVTPGGIISTVAGCGPQGGSCPATYNGGPATGAFINGPFGIAVDSAGNLLLTQTGPLLKVDTVGNMSQEGSNGTEIGVTIGPQDRVIATVNCQAILVPASGGETILAGAPPPTCGYAGDGGPARSASFDFLGGVAADASGDFFVADYYNHRIRRIQAYVAPSVATAITATAGRSSASTQWSTPGGDGGLPIVQYAVKPYLGPTASLPTLVSGSPAATSTLVHRLINGFSYTFTVSASNGWAQGPESAHSPPVTPTITAHGVIDTVAGSPGSGPATALGQDPYAVAWGTSRAGSADHILVGDLANPMLRDVDAQSGQESALAGSDGYGYAGDGGPASAALMYGAFAIADCAGTIYFADTYNYVIRKVDSAGNISTVAGTGQPGYSGDEGPGTKAEIGRVFGLACRTDIGGGLYISDSDNGAVRILDQAGIMHTWFYGFSFPTGIVEVPNSSADDVVVADSGADNAVFELAGASLYLVAGIPGHAGYSGDGGPSTSAMLSDPRGVALYGSWIFVADRGNNRVRLVDATSGNIVSVADGSSLSQPAGLAVDFYSATLDIADTGHRRVGVMALSGGAVTTAAGNGTLSWSGDGGGATAAQLGNPYAVTFDPSGNEYIADNQDNVIRKVDLDGNITTVAGDGIAGFAGDGGLATLAELNDPRGLAADLAGNIYISDTSNQRIRELHTDGTITTVAGNGSAGFSGDGGPATGAGINYPRGLAVDGAGNVYLADTANHRVRRFTIGGSISTFAGNGTGGFSGDGPAGSVQLNLPRSVAFDSAGHLYISDSGNNRVREVINGNMTTVAGNGAAGYLGDGGPATSAELNDPFGVGLDAAGNLYIADTLNHRIRVVDGSGHISSVVGICGAVPGFRGDGGPSYTGQLNYPFGIYVDGAGEIYVADVDNNRVRAGYGLSGTQRLPTCQGPAGIASPRGPVNSLGSSPPPPPRVVDQGAGPAFSIVATPELGHAGATPPDGHVANWRRTTLPAAPGLHATGVSAQPASAPVVRQPRSGAPSTIVEHITGVKSPQLESAPPRVPKLLAIFLALGAPLVLLAVGAARRRRGRRGLG
jgi:sugar lactone lactonase YvrE